MQQLCETANIAHAAALRSANTAIAHTTSTAETDAHIENQPIQLRSAPAAGMASHCPAALHRRQAVPAALLQPLRQRLEVVAVQLLLTALRLLLLLLASHTVSTGSCIA